MGEDGPWAVIAIELWHEDQVLHDEFDSVADFSQWMKWVAERLIRSAQQRSENFE
jgi:hypothetical protein